MVFSWHEGYGTSSHAHNEEDICVVTPEIESLLPDESHSAEDCGKEAGLRRGTEKSGRCEAGVIVHRVGVSGEQDGEPSPPAMPSITRNPARSDSYGFCVRLGS